MGCEKSVIKEGEGSKKELEKRYGVGTGEAKIRINTGVPLLRYCFSLTLSLFPYPSLSGSRLIRKYVSNKILRFIAIVLD